MLHGILPVDKPSGPTSHDIVAQARRRFGMRSVGHAGTLDPMASGVLVLLFGEATKLSDVVTRGDKSYRAVIHFGRSTDTHDAEGRALEERELMPGEMDEARLRDALARELQRTLQVPPHVSAVKVAGQRSYRLHHAGKSIELAPRPVAVRSLSLAAWSPPTATVHLCVSKGYYVRALVRDLAAALGVPLHLAALRRTASGSFELASACPWPPPAGALPVPLADVLPSILPTLRLSASGVQHARQGRSLEVADFIDDPRAFAEPSAEGSEPPLLAWTAADGTPIALGQARQERFVVRRGFAGDLTPQRGSAPFSPQSAPPRAPKP